MSGAFLFLTGLAAFALAINLWTPPRTPPFLAVVTFFAGWLAGELALHAMAGFALVALVLAIGGGLRSFPGAFGFTLTVLACVLFALDARRASRAKRAVHAALRDVTGDESFVPSPTQIDWVQIALPFPVRRAGTTRTRNVPFHEVNGARLTLDVIRGAMPASKCPTLIYVHGGAWVIGKREYQGLPLMLAFAARGFVCFSIDYRLSPMATFPDHLVDVKRAIAWVKENADAYGADRDFVIVAGNSAGAHLASLAALTPNDPEYQPGFENADTHVDACIPFYGVYDFLDRNAHWPDASMKELLERRVMKLERANGAIAYGKASPIDRVHAGAPPFFVVHGDCDTLAPPEESRRFVAALRAVSRGRVGYAEIAGAQHAFEIFPSLRTTHVVNGAAEFAAHVHARRVAR